LLQRKVAAHVAGPTRIAEAVPSLDIDDVASVEVVVTPTVQFTVVAHGRNPPLPSGIAGE
jgi:hypothetical protein